MQSLLWALKRLRARWLLPTSSSVSVKGLNQQFQPAPSGSLHSLLSKMNMLADAAEPAGGSTHPYYRRSRPAPQNPDDFASDAFHIDLTNAHLDPYGVSDSAAKANILFDKRAAAAVSSEAKSISFSEVRFIPSNHPGGGHFVPYDPFEELLDVKSYGDEAPEIKIPTTKSLAVIAYPDFFPSVNDDNYRRIVSEAILAATQGWCGTFGPGVDGWQDVANDHQ